MPSTFFLLALAFNIFTSACLQHRGKLISKNKTLCFENDPIIFSDAKHGYRLFFFRQKIKTFSVFGISFSKLHKDSRKRLQIDCDEKNGG